MFVQVITVGVSDRDALYAALDDWQREVGPGATGLLGGTAGVTADGTAVVTARYETAEQANTNAARREHQEWFAAAGAALATAEPVIKDSVEVFDDIVGNPDEAQFVQVMQGKINDRARAKEFAEKSRAQWADFRPDILGTLMVLHDNDEYTMIIYFTNEEEARAGEQKELPAELASQMEQMNGVFVGEPQYLDLKDPHLMVPPV